MYFFIVLLIIYKCCENHKTLNKKRGFCICNLFTDQNSNKKSKLVALSLSNKSINSRLEPTFINCSPSDCFIIFVDTCFIIFVGNYIFCPLALLTFPSILYLTSTLFAKLLYFFHLDKVHDKSFINAFFHFQFH